MKQAIIKTGGKQYLVKAGNLLNIERLPVALGAAVKFNEVLLVIDGDKVTMGQPLVAGAEVTATVDRLGKLTRVTGYKFKNKVRYTRHLGHRQPFTAVKITGINS